MDIDKLETKTDSQKRYLDAIGYFQKGDISESLKLIKSLNDDQPTFAPGWYLLGFIYDTKLSDLKNAEYCYKMAIAADKYFQPSYLAYKHLLKNENRYKELSDLLSQENESVTIEKTILYEWKGIINEGSGSLHLAKKHYKIMLETSTDQYTFARAQENVQRVKDKLSWVPRVFRNLSILTVFYILFIICFIAGFLIK